MMGADYAVIRITADPARDEPQNVGIVIWSNDQFRLQIDQDAVNEVVRRHPFLASDALSFVDEYVRSGIADAVSKDQGIASALSILSCHPVSITEPRFVAVPDLSVGQFEAHLDRLLIRLVRPVKLQGGRKRGIRDEVKKQFKPLVKHRMLQEKYSFARSRSGSAWTVDYFANSGANIAIDVLSLELQRADDIVGRAAIEAHKLHDVLPDQPVAFKVICQFSEDQRLLDANRRARLLLESVGAEVESDPNRAISEIRSLLHLPVEPSNAREVVSIARR